MSAVDRTVNDRMRRYRERRAQAEADRVTIAEVRRLFDVLGVTTIPAGMTRQDWCDFIDREEARRTHRDERLAAGEDVGWDQ